MINENKTTHLLNNTLHGYFHNGNSHTQSFKKLSGERLHLAKYLSAFASGLNPSDHPLWLMDPILLHQFWFVSTKVVLDTWVNEDLMLYCMLGCRKKQGSVQFSSVHLTLPVIPVFPQGWLASVNTKTMIWQDHNNGVLWVIQSCKVEASCKKEY